MIMTTQLAFPDSFAQRPKLPANTADPDANKNWMVLSSGPNEGNLVANGVLATTANPNEEYFVVPNINPNQSALANIFWQSNLHPSLDTVVGITEDISADALLIGATFVNFFAPDINSAVGIAVDKTVSDNWLVIEQQAVGNPDVVLDTGIPLVVGQLYRCYIRFNDQRKAEVSLGVGSGDLSLLYQSTAFPANVIDRIPLFGLVSDTVSFFYSKADLTIDPQVIDPTFV